MDRNPSLLAPPATPVGALYRPEDGEPGDLTVAVLAHPATHQPERAFVRLDAVATESGYAVKDRRWYELAEDAEAPTTWAALTEDHKGPVFLMRVPRPAA